MKILFYNNKIIYSVINDKIYVSNNFSIQTPELLIKLPLSFIEVILYRLPLINRLFRRTINHLTVVNNFIIIFTNKSIFKYDTISKEIIKYNQYTIDYRVLTLCNYNEKIYFGEYKSNSTRSPIRLLELDPRTMSIKTIHTFEGIRHIHGVFFDKYTDKFWITTGDSDVESIIWSTDKSFNNFERVVYGSQLFRAVKLLFTEKFIYYGTDSPLAQNYICRINRITNKVEKLQKIDSSVFWGCKVKDFLFFSTVVEPSKINTTKYSVVWCSQDGKSWKELDRFKKDVWHAKLFQYGQVLFPSGENNSNYLYCTPFATEKHMKTIKLNFSKLF